MGGWSDDSLPALAAELLQLPVTLIFVAGGPPTAFAVKAATTTIPIVFSTVSDPVAIGLVPSLNQPGGNITGMAVFNATLAAKRIELTKESPASLSSSDDFEIGSIRPNDLTCADSAAQVLPPSRATVPPSLCESSSRVSSLLACYALGPLASGTQYSCRCEP